MNKTATLVYPEIKYPSGTKSYVNNTLQGLAKIGVKYETISIKKVELQFLGKPRLGILFQYLGSLMKRGSTKVVHSLSPEVTIKNTNVVTIHDVIPYVRPDIYINSLYDKAAFALNFSRALKSERILVSTNVGARDLIDHSQVDQEKIRVIPHSIDHEKFYPASQNPYPKDNKIRALMISDFNPRKRLDKIVEKLARDDEIIFYHIGPNQGWENQRQRVLEISRDSKNIFFLGPQPDEELRKYLTYADIFVYLSEHEGFGLPPLEAMACGTNVLVSDIPVFKEVLGDYAHYVSISGFNRDDIHRAVRNKLPSESLRKYSQNFSVEAHAKRLLSVYNEFLG